MFFNKQSVDVINEMTYSELKYYNNWHNIIQGEWKKATTRKGNK